MVIPPQDTKECLEAPIPNATTEEELAMELQGTIEAWEDCKWKLEKLNQHIIDVQS